MIELLDLRAGQRFVELGCGPGWMTRFMARHGLDAHGYDISPAMIEIAREEARRETSTPTSTPPTIEQLDLGHAFDACLTYDALHHSANPERVLAARTARSSRAARSFRAELEAALPGPRRDRRVRHDRARLLAAPPQASAPRTPASPRIRRFHNNRKRLFGNRPADVLAHLAEPLDLPPARAVLDAGLVAARGPADALSPPKTSSR